MHRPGTASGSMTRALLLVHGCILALAFKQGQYYPEQVVGLLPRGLVWRGSDFRFY